MAIRVVQWTTGNVGMRSVRAVAAHPDLELVGCYAWSADKVGVDVGELCGTEPLGVTATNDVDALLALKPDCVVYNPMWPDTGEVVRILEAGVNVVSTAAFINGRSNPADRDRIAQVLDRVPDLRLEVAESAEDGDVIFIRWIAHGTGADGPFQMDGIDRILLEDGLVKENVIRYDSATFERLVGGNNGWPRTA